MKGTPKNGSFDPSNLPSIFSFRYQPPEVRPVDNGCQCDIPQVVIRYPTTCHGLDILHQRQCIFLTSFLHSSDAPYSLNCLACHLSFRFHLVVVFILELQAPERFPNTRAGTIRHHSYRHIYRTFSVSFLISRHYYLHDGLFVHGSDRIETKVGFESAVAVIWRPVHYQTAIPRTKELPYLHSRFPETVDCNLHGLDYNDAFTRRH